MSNSGIIIPDELNQIIKERDKLWIYHDESQNLVKQLEKLGLDITSNSPSELTSQLTRDGIPPAEVAAALSGLQQEMTKISEAQRTIREHKDEIERLEASRRQAIIWAVIIVIILLFIAYAKLAQ